MRRTLFLIPHEIGGIPFFGVGWLLGLMAIFVLVRLAWVWRFGYQPVGKSGDASSKRDAPNRPLLGTHAVMRLLGQEAIVWAVFAALIVFVFPRLELLNVAGDPVGMPIRGYGMFLMLAAIGSVSMAAWRAERAGIGGDAILQLAPWTFIGGLFGARAFYVIQYHEEFTRETWPQTLTAMAALTQGGLVVYGGFIGGFLASVWAVRRFRGSIWKWGDVIVPCIFVGLFFGRLGCLMNGCCYGGQCESNPFSVRFPPGSGVYAEQLVSGDLIGLETSPVTGFAGDDADDANETEGKNRRATRTRLTVKSVRSGSLADESGIEAGQTISLLADPGFVDRTPLDRPAEDALPGLAIVRQGELVARFGPDELPERARPVWATQVISSIVAAIMFVALLLLERILHRRGVTLDGLLMLCGFVAYAVLRILLEWVRVDEAGQFGTSLSISQWVSIVVIVLCGIAIWFRLRSAAWGELSREKPEIL